MNEPVEVLRDRFGRVHRELRISVTDRCNIRCRYCFPEKEVHFRPHDEILSFEEITRIAVVAARLGISELRLTGGEPLVRKGISQLVAMLAQVPGISDLAMTTNGILLAEHAVALRAAGLVRLNVSLDTLDPQKYYQLTGSDQLSAVLEGIEAARAAGFQQIKLNALAIHGSSEKEIVPLARFAREHGLELRFIEYMPTQGAEHWRRDRVLTAEEILAALTATFGPLVPLALPGHNGPAREYRFADGHGAIGVIPAVSDPFCGNCRRLRLTADGKLRNCLFSSEHWDVRAVLRGGADEELAQLIQRAVWDKKFARGSEDGHLAPLERPMYQIGG